MKYQQEGIMFHALHFINELQHSSGVKRALRRKGNGLRHGEHGGGDISSDSSSAVEAIYYIKAHGVGGEETIMML